MRKLQVALDILDLNEALEIAKLVYSGGADILEAGTPLIKSEGVNAIKELRNHFPITEILADLKIMDTGKLESEMAYEAGADMVVVEGWASDNTIKEVKETAQNYDKKWMVATTGTEMGTDRIKSIINLQPDYVLRHVGIDDQNYKNITDILTKDELELYEGNNVGLAMAGGITLENIYRLHEPLNYISNVVYVVGNDITNSKNPEERTRLIKKKIQEL
jgi:3-hexulose-6-phosphate synthase/6-phospho-3-hexuloisomerase